MAKSPHLQRRPIRNSGFSCTDSVLLKENNTTEEDDNIFQQDSPKRNKLYIDEDSAEESEEEITEILERTAKGTRTKSIYPDLGACIHEQQSSSTITKEIKQRSPIHDHTQKSPQLKDGLNFNNLTLFGVFIVIGLFCVTYMLPYLRSKSASQTSSTLSVVKELKSNFPNQLELSWRIIKSALDEVVNKTDPTQPAIVLFLSTKGAEKVTDCIAKHLANLVANLYGEDYPNMSGLKLKGEPDNIKKFIDNTFQEVLTDQQHHVILINHLDSVPSQAAMMLHSYCDHENAPYKHAIFIMTIYGEENISSNADSREFDRVANHRLSEVWHDLGKDQLFALLSRIVVSVAAIIPEEMSSHCF